jgi:Phage tail protein (Tail_P2_I)
MTASDRLLPPSIRDQRFKAFLEVLERVGLIDLSVLEIYDIDNVDVSALLHLADQFDVLGLKGYSLTSTEAQRRSLIKESIPLHQRAGTPFAVRRAMALVGYPDATIEENPPLRLDGSWKLDGSEMLAGLHIAKFIVYLDVERSGLISRDKIELIVALVGEWKNTRSELLDLRIGEISLFKNLLVLDGSWQLDAGQELDGEKNIV